MALLFLIGAGLIAVGVVCFLVWLALDDWSILFVSAGCVGLGALLVWAFGGVWVPLW